MYIIMLLQYILHFCFYFPLAQRLSTTQLRRILSALCSVIDAHCGALCDWIGAVIRLTLLVASSASLSHELCHNLAIKTLRQEVPVKFAQPSLSSSGTLDFCHTGILYLGLRARLHSSLLFTSCCWDLCQCIVITSIVVKFDVILLLQHLLVSRTILVMRALSWAPYHWASEGSRLFYFVLYKLLYHPMYPIHFALQFCMVALPHVGNWRSSFLFTCGVRNWDSHLSL